MEVTLGSGFRARNFNGSVAAAVAAEGSLRRKGSSGIPQRFGCCGGRRGNRIKMEGYRSGNLDGSVAAAVAAERRKRKKVRAGNLVAAEGSLQRRVSSGEPQRFGCGNGHCGRKVTAAGIERGTSMVRLRLPRQEVDGGGYRAGNFNSSIAAAVAAEGRVSLRESKRVRQSMCESNKSA